jgi:surfeit locus 1 family protein
MLVWLGSWQLVRMHWKNDLIEEFTTRAHTEAVVPPATDAAAENRFQRISASGIWMHDAEVQLTGRTFEGTAGYHVITPMRLDDGRILLLNRGWVSQDYRLPEKRPATLAAGPQKVEAIVRWPKRKGYFVPENDIEDDHWFTLNIEEIAAHHELANVITTYTADVLRPEGPYVLPIGAAVTIDISNNHWHYALTWFGIALGLIGVYTAWHHQNGRLHFARKDKGKS